MAPKLFPLISSATSQKRKPFDKLLNRNLRRYHGHPSSPSYRFSAFKLFGALFIVALLTFFSSRSAKMFALATKYSDQILENNAVRMPSKTSSHGLIIHHPDPESTEKDEQISVEKPEKPNSIVDEPPGNEDSYTDTGSVTDTESNMDGAAPTVPDIDSGSNMDDTAPIVPVIDSETSLGDTGGNSESSMDSTAELVTENEQLNDDTSEFKNTGQNNNESSEERAVETSKSDGAEEGKAQPTETYNNQNNNDDAQDDSGDDENPDVFLKDAPLHAMNPTGENFKAYDINEPTKVEVPENGFPPRNLPKGHAYRELLRNLRQKTELHPRWPNHPELHLAELKSYGPAYASIIISDKLKVVYVPVFKVGTTSMMWNIAYLENNPAVVNANIENEYERDYILHDFNSNAWSNHAIYALSSERVRSTMNDPSYLKFGFVRNPYHRVVSAYLDKVVKWPFESAEYQGQMYGLYGTDHETRKFRNHTKPSFKEYLNAIEKVISAPRTEYSDLTKPGSYEDNNSRREIHFRPQVELLHPDLIHFDFIGRFDNMKNDTKEVLQWMYKSTERRMPENNRRRKLHSTDPVDKVAIFKRLREDEELKNTLLRIYKDDFQRFGFSKEVPDAMEHKD